MRRHCLAESFQVTVYSQQLQEHIFSVPLQQKKIETKSFNPEIPFYFRDITSFGRDVIPAAQLLGYLLSGAQTSTASSKPPNLNRLTHVEAQHKC